MRFIIPKIDFAFKKIFGSVDSPDILMSFLNALLYEGKPKIKNLEIIDPYSSINPEGLKDGYLDIKATLDSQHIVIIEMQVLNVAAFDKRVIYNAAKTYATQIKSGEGYFKLNPVTALTITDFRLFERHERAISRYRFKDLEDLGDPTNNEMELIFVELPKFKKSLEELETIADRWIYFLKNATELESIPPQMQVIPELTKAMKLANRASLSLEERECLEKREMFFFDQIGAVKKGIEEGLEEGRRLGLQQGLEQGFERGERQLVLRLLYRRFRQLTPELQNQIERLSSSQLETLSDNLFEFNDMGDLQRWLSQLK